MPTLSTLALPEPFYLPTHEECRYKHLTATVGKDADPDGRAVIPCFMTTDGVDADDEVVLPSGIILDRFTKNPVVMLCHAYGQPGCYYPLPVGTAEWTRRRPHGVMAGVRFTEKSEMGREVKALFDDDILRSFSIGFRPMEMSPMTRAEAMSRADWMAAYERTGGKINVHRKCELLELSVAPVPSNPEALRVKYKAKGATVPGWVKMPALPPLPPPAAKIARFDLGRMKEAKAEAVGEPPEPDAEGITGAAVTAADARVMIGLWLPPDAARRLALPGGEPAEELHLTLCYLGRAIEVGTNAIERVKRMCADIAATSPPLMGQLSGVGRFSASATSEGRDVVYASADIPDLAELRQRIAWALESLGVAYSKAHGFTPHVTLAYVDPAAASPIERLEPISVALDRFCLVVEGARTDFPFNAIGYGYGGQMLAWRSAMDVLGKGIGGAARKGAVPFHSCANVSEHGWDGQTAIERIRKHCSRGNTGKKEDMDWAAYERFFTWVDSTDRENFTSYKMPHHDIVGGEFVLLRHKLAMNVGELHGGRAGGLAVPEGDLAGIESHLRKHYEEDLKEPFPGGKPSTQNTTGGKTMKGVHPEDKSGMCKMCKAVAAVARTIKHSGDYGMAFYNHETKAVHHTMADGDGEPEYDGAEEIQRKYMAIEGVKAVHVESESSPSEEDGYYQVHPEPKGHKCARCGKTDAAKAEGGGGDGDGDADDAPAEMKAGDHVRHKMGRYCGVVKTVHTKGTHKLGHQDDDEGRAVEAEEKAPVYELALHDGDHDPSGETAKHLGKSLEPHPGKDRRKGAMSEASGAGGGFGVPADSQADRDREDADDDQDNPRGKVAQHDYVDIDDRDRDHKGVGQVMSIHKSGDFVPHVEESVMGTKDEPAALVRRYKAVRDGHVKTDVYTAHHVRHLTKRARLEPPSKAERKAAPAQPLALPSLAAVPAVLPSLKGIKSVQAVSTEKLTNLEALVTDPEKLAACWKRAQHIVSGGV